MKVDHVVMGGGPAGAAAACTLAKGGREVLLIERNATAAHKVCGDFLSAGAADNLSALGVDLAALDASRIEAIRFVHGTRVAQTPLPFRAWGLSRFALDEALLQQATTMGATLQRGKPVRSLREMTLETDGLGSVEAKALFLATGKHDLRGARRRGDPSGLVGFKTYCVPEVGQLAELHGFVEIVLFDGGYAGLQCVEGGHVTVCLLVSRNRLLRAGQDWESLLRALMAETPHLARRLATATGWLRRSLAISGMPYGYVHTPKPGGPRHLFRLGDQVGVIPSLAGDGITIALLSGRLAASLHLGGSDASVYHRRLARELARPVGLATLLHRLCLTRARPLLVSATQAAPALIRLAATWTRVPSSLRVGVALG
jgi:flavin-dependent dehydrogenase